MVTDFKTHKRQLLKDPQVKQAYDDLEPEFQVARAVIQARIDRGVTQKQLAKKMHTTPSVISRLENANTVPSLSFLKRLAKALDLKVSVHLAAG